MNPLINLTDQTPYIQHNRMNLLFGDIYIYLLYLVRLAYHQLFKQL